MGLIMAILCSIVATKWQLVWKPLTRYKLLYSHNNKQIMELAD